ncbi:hypothetical protein E1A91_A10G016800v1 [Gossypium mustelinum]|uniref:NB-ARC domain-containing protein n=1 Tax=Gossypium mustelinum TaxID=34275 RepID=A0A5D2XFZ5_GOSMU|nr:hypothetical protein E1A91_A10G016800v1 [Gossypium mustelinum]
MAEGILFHLAGKVSEGLGSLAAEELEAALGLKEETEKLARTGSAIRAVLRDAEDQRNRNNHQVRFWLENLKDVLYDVEDLLDEFTCDALRQKIVAGDGKPKKVRLFFSTSNQLAYGLKMAPKVKAIRERLDAIAADKANFQLSDCPVETPIEVRERDQTYSFELSEEIIGRDYDKNKITTLAKMVFNDEKLGDHFALKMWVCVSEKFELKVIVEKVIEAATKTKPERDLQLETLQHHLRDSIKGKKYLLVLDDVWNDDPEKWRNLRNLLSGGARGGWIVITTRSRFVAEITGTEPHHNLRGLSGSESWSLLKQTAFKEASRESNNSRIEAIGMEIVDKCKGVPLALRAIGKVLYKRTEAEWVKVNKNVHKYLTHEEEVPKDTSFSVPMLIQLWMALGFVQPLSEDKDLEDTGYEYFKDLVWRSFLDCESMDYLGKSWFTMHDLMHDLACSVAGKEYCIVSLEEENVSERSRHVSFDNSSGEMGNTLLKATKVRSFAGNMDLPLYQQNYMASIANCKYLRMLDLSGSDIKMLPHSIGNLKHLKALYLSGNRYLLKLPSSLSRLQLLETLDLNGCSNFRTLPNKTSRLVSLKHLLIDGCHKLDYMPRGLGKLTRLQTLRWFVVGRTTGKNVGQLSELNGLNKLKGELHILGLQNAIAKHGSTYLKDKLNLKSLVLGWGCRGGEDETLRVIGYPGSKMSSWLSSVTNLSELILYGFGNCQHLQPLHQLYSLKVIRLSRLEALEIVSETEMQELVSGKSTTTFLPSLEELEINDCPNLKGWWKGDVGEASNPHLPCFPCLSHLIIKHCPNLTTMPLFPSVKTLKLKNTSSKPFQETMKLKMTKIEAPSSSTLHPLSKLVSLEIDEVKDLHSLQEEFLQNLTSLQTLMIRECINLTSMPEGMPGLTSLNHLEIIDCPQLSKRCQRNTGLDWPKSAHIERIRIEEGGIVEHYRGSRGTN